MTELPDLHSINWHSDTCECKVEVRQYVIGRTPAKIVRGPVPTIEPERVWCYLRKIDGTVEEILMRVTTIEEMVKSGLQPDYWAEARKRQLEQIEQTEGLIQEIQAGLTPLDRADDGWIERMGGEEKAAQLPDPRDLEGWQGYLAKVRHGKTYADHEGYRRSPGTQLRGHLSHRCDKHHNQTSTSLQSQIAHYRCGCVTRQITVGERREEGVTHEQWVEICPWHKWKLEAEGVLNAGGVLSEKEIEAGLAGAAR